MIPFPKGKFKVIYADPPWTYRDKARSGKRGSVFKYPSMSTAELKQLPLASIADETGCTLFCWSTMPQLPVALSVIEHWGFRYRTVAFVWIKLNKVALTPFMGMGSWTRANAELVLLATRGKPKRQRADIHSVVMEPIGKHSQKPAAVRNRIERLMGPVPRIELFARQHPFGWTTWGDEV